MSTNDRKETIYAEEHHQEHVLEGLGSCCNDLESDLSSCESACWELHDMHCQLICCDIALNYIEYLSGVYCQAVLEGGEEEG